MSYVHTVRTHMQTSAARLLAVALCAGAAGGHAAHKGVPHPERSLLNQHRGDRSPAGIEFRLHHHALSGTVGIGLQLQQLPFQQNHLQ